MRWCVLHGFLFLVCLAAARLAVAQQIGTDITGLNLCLYGDCEARGAYAADPHGWPPLERCPTSPAAPFSVGATFA
jgi:hypothetical protein